MDNCTLNPYRPPVNIRTVDVGSIQQIPRENDRNVYAGNMLALSPSGLSADDKDQLAKCYGVTPEIIYEVMSRMNEHGFETFRVKEIIEAFINDI